MSEVARTRDPARAMPIGIAVTLMVLIGAVGSAAGWLLHFEREPGARLGDVPVLRRLAARLSMASRPSVVARR